MPELNGVETSEKIREFNSQTPIIALTATSFEEAKLSLNSGTINDFILKPFITSEFIDKILLNITASKKASK